LEKEKDVGGGVSWRTLCAELIDFKRINSLFARAQIREKIKLMRQNTVKRQVIPVAK
jgi:hypothetical protein